jgi:hypothetical protein
MTWPTLPAHDLVSTSSWPKDHQGQFSSTDPVNFPPHDPVQSAAWPTGHYDPVSKGWPGDHAKETSLTWPVGHNGTDSQLGDFPKPAGTTASLVSSLPYASSMATSACQPEAASRAPRAK